MNSLDSMKMNKNSKSRIPVSVVKQKFSSVCNDKKSLQSNSCFQKTQTSDASKATKVHIMHQKTEKKMCLQPPKSKYLKDSNIKNPDCKKKQPPLKTSTEYVSTKNKTFENDIKSDKKNKLLPCRANTKSNSANERVTKFCNVNTRKLPPSCKIKTKSGIDKNSIEDKKENFPSPKSCSYEVEACTPKGNQITSKDDHFSSHENVEFEANEFYRKMILSNIELSPSVRKLMPNLRLSSLQSERPSIYQKLQIPDDPLKEALKALENTCLSVKRIKKDDKFVQSPRRDAFRSSIYTPRGNPNEEFLKRLEDYKLKQLQKTAPRSNKKVTFNLNVQECMPNNINDVQHNSFKNTQHALVQINEKSEENTPSSPCRENSNEIKLSDISSVHVHNNKSSQVIETNDYVIKVDDFNSTEIKSADQIDSASTKNHRAIEPVMTKRTIPSSEISLQILKKISSQNFSSDFICDSPKVEKYTNCLKDNNMQFSEQKKCKQSAKIYTPKPISFSSKCKRNESISPEFLVGGKATVIANLAPICTPLVLKSQANNIMFSPEADGGPIPLKLDFEDEEKDSPKKEISKNHTLFTLDNILTFQKKLDDLADQECYLSLINENFPVICGRYLKNPVAMTLNEGDDMHFIPVHF